MGTIAPKPPTKRLFAATCVTGGLTLGMAAIVAFGHFAYSSIPTPRLIAYSLAALVSACVAATLAGRYLVQKCRRDAWWDGHAACDNPDADSMPLRRIQAELAELTEAVLDLADAAGRPRAPQPRAQPAGSTYTSRAVQDDTVMITRHAEPSPVQLAEREPADPIAEARVEGYVEGYADGITRRGEGVESD
jgi:hypothetical protein